MTPEERALWDVDPDEWPHTPPLHIFRELMDEDDNTWWRAGSGHGLNAYEAAIERIEELEAQVVDEEYREQVRRLVEKTCAEQGVPVKITDPAVLRRIATLLQTARNSRETPGA